MAKCDLNVLQSEKNYENISIHLCMKCIHFYEFEGDLSTTHFYICHADWIKERIFWTLKCTRNEWEDVGKKKSVTYDNNRKSKEFKFRQERNERKAMKEYQEEEKKTTKSRNWNTRFDSKKNQIPDLILWYSKTYTKYH